MISNTTYHEIATFQLILLSSYYDVNTQMSVKHCNIAISFSVWEWIGKRANQSKSMYNVLLSFSNLKDLMPTSPVPSPVWLPIYFKMYVIIYSVLTLYLHLFVRNKYCKYKKHQLKRRVTSLFWKVLFIVVWLCFSWK